MVDLRGRRYAPLVGNYFYDDRIGAAGLFGELLYLRGLAFCAENLSDGFMSDRQVRTIISIDFDDVAAVVERLVDVGLWMRDDQRKGYVVRTWEQYNATREQITRRRAIDRARKRRTSMNDGDEPRSEGAGAVDSSGNPSGIRAESDRIHGTTTQHNTTQQDSVRPLRERTDGVPAAGADLGRLRDEQISRPFAAGRRKRADP